MNVCLYATCKYDIPSVISKLLKLYSADLTRLNTFSNSGSTYHHCHNLIMNSKRTVAEYYKEMVGSAASLLFTTCYVFVVYDLLRHCCLRRVTSLLFTTCYVIVVYDVLRHCCLRLVTSLLFTTCYVIEQVIE